MRPLLERFEEKVMPVPWSGCHIWMGADTRGGYGHLREGGLRNMRRAHQIAYELYKGKVPKGMWVLHKCDVRCCVNPEHLFLGTCQDNTDDKIKKGRHNWGVKEGYQRLNQQLVDQYREEWNYYRWFMKQYEFAEMMGISKQQMSRVLNNQIWRSENV